MLNIKKISPTEFRLHNKLFYVAYTPNNYFEAFRFEIIFQYLLMWFFEEFGVYFYIQKLKLIDDTVLFQLYFYKTYLMVNSTSLDIRYRAAGEVETFLDYPDLFKPTINLRYYNRNLLEFFVKRKSNKRTFVFKKKSNLANKEFWKRHTNFVIKYDSAVEKITETTNPQILDMKPWRPRKNNAGKGGHKYIAVTKNLVRKRKPYAPRWLPKKKALEQSKSLTKRATPFTSFNFFFTYFFLHFFKYSSVILYKSLYKLVFTNKVYQKEHSKLLYKTRYLQNTVWIYDLYFFMNYALTFANTTFLFPFFVYHLTERFKQKRSIIHMFNLLRVLYYYKLNIRGIKILVNGPFDRHGRSRHLVLKIGDISLIEYRSYIMYDSIQCPTLYGTINLKFWVHYTDANLNLNSGYNDVALPKRA